MAVASEHVYKVIREGIFAGRFSEGERLREAELSRTFGVSRTPVREALRRLVAEGLVVGEPHKGVVIAQLSEEDIHELFTLRSLLEGYAARKAALGITDEGVEKLRNIESEIERVFSEKRGGFMRDVRELNTEFHELLFSFTGNPQLVSFISILNHMPITESTFARYTEEGVHRSINCHHQLIEALHARDPEWAEAAMRNHILSARDMYMSRHAEPIE